jgi:hypothetical protein
MRLHNLRGVENFAKEKLKGPVGLTPNQELGYQKGCISPGVTQIHL